MDLSTLSFKEQFGGRRVSFEIELENMHYGDRKVGDIVRRNIQIKTAFDGTMKVSIGSFAYRLWCKNGAVTPIALAVASFKNTIGNVGKAPMIASNIIAASKRDEMFHQNLNEYLNRKVSKTEVSKFILKIMGKKNMDEVLLAKSPVPRELFDAINTDVAIEMANTGRNLFSLVQGITRYSTHTVAGGNRDKIMLGSANKKYNQPAFALAARMS